MKSPTPVTYVFHGTDEPTLREALAAFSIEAVDAAMVDLNTTRIDGTSSDIGEIQSAASTAPFLSETRLVIVENVTEANASRIQIDDLAPLIAHLPDWARLVFVERGLSELSQDTDSARRRKVSRKTALKKLINMVEGDPRGKVFAFDVPRDMHHWMSQRAELYGATIEARASQLLAERVGEDLLLADSEIAKLSTYTNGERAIAAEDVELLTSFTPEANIFHMVDALALREGERAMLLLRQLLDAGDEPLRLFGMIVRQYRLLIQMREHLDDGGTPNSAMQAMGIKDFVARKLAGQARHYSMDQLERIYRYLLEMDISMKGGIGGDPADDATIDRLDPAFALEEFVAKLSR